MNRFSFLLALAWALVSTSAFTAPLISQARVVAPAQPDFARFSPALLMASDDGVVELAEDDEATPESAVAMESKGEEEEEKVVAPFLSQGEISEEAVDLSDPKQARVMFYIILSLLPVLFLIPLMLGSRDLIPQDALPPVTLQ
eukprot:CAMPEP_0113623872 /NCGR_PEP_ID=MMETSP0017_2-20120614/12298_1 /TAXON_ID=2856 /ORGANISM="Cylindrotheca closterium" /LENGTH=142 /DNA_ID=CAMNT_0000533869 /DNA_START=39 /DNA_END=467 /DNA_ORIENTATION=+ /assembly_acc=CAM_ASM_000147